MACPARHRDGLAPHELEHAPGGARWLTALCFWWLARAAGGVSTEGRGVSAVAGAGLLDLSTRTRSRSVSLADVVRYADQPPGDERRLLPGRSEILTVARSCSTHGSGSRRSLVIIPRSTASSSGCSRPSLGQITQSPSRARVGAATTGAGTTATDCDGSRGRTRAGLTDERADPHDNQLVQRWGELPSRPPSGSSPRPPRDGSTISDCHTSARRTRRASTPGANPRWPLRTRSPTQTKPPAPRAGRSSSPGRPSCG